METTIRINPKTKEDLDQFRQYKNESYDEVVRKLIHLVKLSEKEPNLSQKTIQDIREARERIKKGEFYTQEEIEKRFRL
jgi:predicted transcriptional regulator